MTKLKPYTKYKDSGIDWVGEIPEDWKIQPLISVGKIKKITGQTHRELLSVYLNKGVIRFTDVDEKRTNVTSKDLSKYQSVDEGDFVLNNQQAWRGSVGVSSYKGIVSPAYLIVKLNLILDPEFANYMLRDKSLVSQFLIYSKGVGSIQRNLYWNDLKRIDLFIPPKETQKVIANYLNTKSKEIDKYIKKLKKEIALLKEHRQKIISQAVTCGLDDNGKLRKKPEWKEGDPLPKGWKDSGVEWLGLIPEGWEIRRLGYLGSFKKGKGISKDSLTEDGEPVILYGDIYTKYEVQTKKLLRKAPTSIACEAERIKKFDVLFTGSGETKEEIGKCVVYLGDEYGYAGGDTIIFTPHSSIDSVFLSYLMYSAEYLSIKAGLSKGQIIIHIYSSGLKTIPIVLPSLKNQEKISKYLDQVSLDIKKQVRKITEQIEFIKEYKQSLISKVVTGKLDVRNINIAQK